MDKSVQYGESIKAFAVYLSKHQMIPYKRLKEIFSDMFNTKISTGTLINFNKQCFKLLENVEINIKQALINSKILHSDETGVKSAGKLQWVHVATNNDFTHYGFHPKRGKDAINEIGILPYFKNILVHDCFSSYNTYTEATHVMCGAHILRELNGITELEKQSWAQDFFNHLVYIKKCIEDTIEAGKNSLDFKLINEIILKYDDILNNGRLEDGIINAKFYADLTHSKKSKALNLINRLILYKERMLAFMYDFNIPFTNNLAERDLRMLKVSQKISGSYRGEFGAAWDMRIKGYFSSIRKNGIDLIKSIKSIFSANIIDPTLAQS